MLEKKIKLIKGAVIKNIAAMVLGINRKNIYHKNILDKKDKSLKDQIEDVWKTNPSY